MYGDRSLFGHSSDTACPISFKFGMQASLVMAYTMVSFDYFEVFLIAEIEASDNSMCPIIGALLYICM